METLLTDEIKAWIGRRVQYVAPEPIGRASIRYFARAIGDDDPIYVDNAVAKAVGFPGIVAPPTFVCESIQYMNADPDDEGYMGHIWRLPVENCRRLRGGCEYRFYKAVTPDVILTVEWRIESIVEKTSSSRNEPMLILKSLVSYFDQRGDLLATSLETTIYQPNNSLKSVP